VSAIHAASKILYTRVLTIHLLSTESNRYLFTICLTTCQ